MEERSVFGGMMPGITGSPAVRERGPASPPGLESDGCSGRGVRTSAFVYPAGSAGFGRSRRLPLSGLCGIYSI